MRRDTEDRRMAGGNRLFWRRRHSRSSDRIGAVVVGGDFQGLGIARNLGRRGVPICIIDDELSISRFSRYTTHAVAEEHFIYATKAKAWRANNRTELRELFQRAVRQVGLGEVMIQDLIPGDGRQQFAYCAFFKGGRAVGSMVVRRSRQHPPEFGRASTFVETVELPLLEALSERFLRRSEER